jgi:hypothetical protein
MLASRGVPVVCSGSLAVLALLACGPQVELETDTTDGTPGSGSTTDSPTTVATTVGPATDPTLDTGTDDGPVPTERAVDILFVVDNSGSMGEEQAKLANAVDAFVATLDAVDPPLDYRVGVTTTDNGNPWCGTTGPEAGNLRATSCRSRLTEFVFDGATMVDITQQACRDVCSLEALGIADGVPWIDVARSTGSDNVGGQVTENLRCMLPQGINGCGFESHLESMYKAILRFEDENEDEYGFHRAGALLAVVFVTDEVDCSYNNDWETIFLPDGDRVFWSDQTSASPTSAVCWNAGVACDGAQCYSVDLDASGNELSPADADDQAVLRPVSRYTGQLAERGAYVFAINGVGLDGVPVYMPALMDPQFQNDFGIGPGCESVEGTAVPPVRIHELIGTISGSGHEGSVCAGEYASALSVFAQGLVDRLP